MALFDPEKSLVGRKESVLLEDEHRSRTLIEFEQGSEDNERELGKTAIAIHNYEGLFETT